MPDPDKLHPAASALRTWAVVTGKTKLAARSERMMPREIEVREAKAKRIKSN